MTIDYPALLADLWHETNQLVDRLQTLSFVQWGLPTPAAGWSIQDQVSHLAFFDDCARQAFTDPAGFRRLADRLIEGGMDFPDRITEQHRLLAPDTLLVWFVTARRELIDTFAGQNPKHRMPWFGPDMSVASAVTARLMETWAHGQDVYDALGVVHPPSPGLRSIAHLGVATFAFTHKLHGLEVPTDPVRVELRSEAGDIWTWGPPDADQRVSGPAEDFVLVVTQRRHWSETALHVEGFVARNWLDIAQAFAGAPSRRMPRAVRT